MYLILHFDDDDDNVNNDDEVNNGSDDEIKCIIIRRKSRTSRQTSVMTSHMVMTDIFCAVFSHIATKLLLLLHVTDVR